MNPKTYMAISRAPSRKIFSPLFKARWQNMQNIVNDTIFENEIGDPFKTYYETYIRQWLQWSRGFVPMLHSSDFFSLGMGYTVCEIIARECMVGGYSFVSKSEEAKGFIEEWAGKDFDGFLSEVMFSSAAGGNSIMALTPCDGELYVTQYPIDRIVFSVGRKNVITRAKIFNRFTAGETAYYARETRYMLDGKPYYKVDLSNATNVLSPSWSGGTLDSVPEAIFEQWKNAYGGIRPGIWYELPLRSIGLYNVRNKAFAVALSDMPGYSDSSLHTALDILYDIDYNYTQAAVDQYLGKGRGLVPKSMNKAGAQRYVVQGETMQEALYGTEAQPLDDIFYEQVQSQTIDGDVIKPTFMQAELRGQERKFIRDADLELLAAKVGLSSSTLANHLNNNRQKTATEYNGEHDTTETTVNEKQDLATPEINRMIAEVLAFYGVEGEVVIQWGESKINSSEENQELLGEYNAGTLTLRQYLRRRWRGLSECEIEDMAAEIERERPKQEQQFPLWNESDYYGNDKTAENQFRKKQENNDGRGIS